MVSYITSSFPSLLLPPYFTMHLLCCTVEEEEEEGENDSDQLPTLKVTWKAKKSDESNGGYSEEVLRNSLSQVSYKVMIRNILVI